MKFDEVHFENAKGHATVLLKNAEKALEEGKFEYVGWCLNDARSYLVTMSLEVDRDGAPDAVRAKYKEIAARYDETKAKYNDDIRKRLEDVKKAATIVKNEKEKDEEIAARYHAAKEAFEKQEVTVEQEEALTRFDETCRVLEGLLDDYAEELAENHCESDATEKAIVCKLVRLLNERRELLHGDVNDARWLRVERLKYRFHNLKRLGTIARRFWKIKDALFE